MNDGRPRPTGDPVAGIDVEHIPPDPAALVTALAQAVAAVHDGRDGVIGDGAGLTRLDPEDALAAVERAVARGWVPPDGSPYAVVGGPRVLTVLRDGVGRAAARASETVPTIGRATFSNLVLPVPGDDRALSGSANLTFRSRRLGERPHLADRSAAALGDPYRDLAVAAADVVAAFGPGAVLGFTAAYVEARPSIEPLDPIRLDWWSLVAAVLGGAR